MNILKSKTILFLILLAVLGVVEANVGYGHTGKGIADSAGNQKVYVNTTGVGLNATPSVLGYGLRYNRHH